MESSKIFSTLFRAEGEGEERNRPPSTFLYLAQTPLYFMNRHLSTFPIYLLGLRFGYGVCEHRGHNQIQKFEKGYKNSTF